MRVGRPYKARKKSKKFRAWESGTVKDRKKLERRIGEGQRAKGGRQAEDERLIKAKPTIMLEHLMHSGEQNIDERKLQVLTDRGGQK